MPKLQYCKGKGDIWGYIDAYHLDEGTCMVSWRAADAPIFTLAYRGNEVDALQAIAERNPSIESCDMSRTVLFSHSTGECFVAKKSIHLHPGDPQLILQVRLEGDAVTSLCLTHMLWLVVPITY